jgi:uroporphyrinogen-III synthase
MQTQQSIFVSRDLSPQSCFFGLAEKWSLDLHYRSLLRFTPLPFTLPLSLDWLFFYSAKGVSFFYDQQPVLPAGVKLGAIGAATGARVRETWGRIDFIGSGDPVATLEAFAPQGAGQNLVFVRASQSSSTLAEHMKPRARVQELVVYENKILEGLSLPHTQWAVLTSTMSARAYLDSVEKPAQHLIAIGRPTAQYLQQRGHSQLHQAENPSEEALCKLCDTLLAADKSADKSK